MAKPAEADAKAPKEKSSKKGMLIWAAITLLLVCGSVAGTLFYVGALPPGSAQAAMVNAPETAASRAIPADQGPALYVNLDPAYILTFELEGETRFIQVSVSAMSRSQDTIEVMETNRPRIRHALIMLFGSQNYEDLAATEGKERLRMAVLEEIRSVIRMEGRVPELEDVYFTNFVRQ